MDEKKRVPTQRDTNPVILHLMDGTGGHYVK
jgi:hypothetical protein